MELSFLSQSVNVPLWFLLTLVGARELVKLRKHRKRRRGN